MSQEFPWFPLWVDDFRTSRAVRTMSMEALGLYTLVLCEMWDGGPIADDVDQVALLIGRPPASIEAPWKEVRAVLKKTRHGLISERLEAERKRQQEKRAKVVKAGRKGAAARWKNGDANGDANGDRIAPPMRPQYQSEPEVVKLPSGADTTSSGGVTPGPRGGGRRDPSGIRAISKAPNRPIDPEWEKAVDESTEAERRLRGMP